MVGSLFGFVFVFLVSIMNSLISLVMSFCRFLSVIRILLALSSSFLLIMILNGLSLMCCLFLKIFIKCFLILRGVKEIFEIKYINIKNFFDKFFNYC